jgi:hypothetical protein
MHKFVWFEEAVHLLSPLSGGEFTLCGVAFDAADSEQDTALCFEETNSKTVTCEECMKVIKHCRKVRVS